MHEEELFRLIARIEEQLDRIEKRLDRMIERNEEMLERLRDAHETLVASAVRRNRIRRTEPDLYEDDNFFPDHPLPLIEPWRRALVPNRSGFLAAYLDEWVDAPRFSD